MKLIKFKIILITMLPLSLLLSCATLSKEECLTANWEAIGFSDGASGYGGDRIGSHNQACAKISVAPNLQAWEQGRQKGLKQYCTESNAYQIGKAGRQLNNVCPANTTRILQRINADGREVYNLSRQLQTDNEQLVTYQQELSTLQQGGNLTFDSEQEARTYMLTLPRKIRDSKMRINNEEQRLVELKRLYGY